MLGAILGAVSGVGSLLGGIFGKSAAEKAAEIQANAARAAGDKAIQTANEVNPLITGAATAGAEQARTAAGESIAGVREATGTANQYLQPFIDTGTKASGLLSTALDTSGQMPTLADLQIDPGYQFRVSEGQKALLSRAAALGGATGGGVLKALTNYRGQEASQEYASAFDRYFKTKQANVQNLLAATGVGLSAGSTAGTNLMNASRYAGDLNYGSTTYGADRNYNAVVQTGNNSINASRTAADYLTQAANAQAGGIVGGTNALWGGITGAAGGVASGIALNQLLKNPASAYGAPSSGYGYVIPRNAP